MPAPTYVPSVAQRALISKLTDEITAQDAAAGALAVNYTARMDEAQAWTAGRDGNASRWIDRLIVKARELKTTATTPAEIPDGRYAVEEDGALKFFKVKNGNRPGFVFLDIQASDDWHAIRNVTRIRAIIDLIAVDPKAAMIRYGRELGVCGHCGRTLTDEASRAAGIGPICASK
jgi:hypothetical protein